MSKNKPSTFRMNAHNICLPLKKSPCQKTQFPRETRDTFSKWCCLWNKAEESLVLTIPHKGLTSIFSHFAQAHGEHSCHVAQGWGLGLRHQEQQCCRAAESPSFACSTCKRSLGVVTALLCLILEYFRINSGGQNFRAATSRGAILHGE